MEKKTLANIFIANARARTGMLQKELAHRLGITADLVSQYETGRRQPTERVIAQVEQILIELGLDTAACNPAEAELLAMYRELPTAAKEEMLTAFRNLVASHKTKCGLR